MPTTRLTRPRWSRMPGRGEGWSATVGHVALRVQPSQTRPGQWLWSADRLAKRFSGVRGFHRFGYRLNIADARDAAEAAAEEANS